MADAGNGVKDMRENAKDTGSIPHESRKKTLRASLFKPDSVSRLQAEYTKSQPYQHLVIPDLMDDEVLHGACEELKTNMQATLKETDIFKVYQTGDLANMDGLPEESKLLLPSLFAIRDGLYSLEFRRLVQSLTGSGPLSGEQIDLSVNAFGHTGHLLCHDDVIGTRKVSYILYLVDKDWGLGEKPDGGGLQLYPLEKEGVPGIPAYAPSKTIPPRWNQMVLFAVQPGRSFHDVQEIWIHQHRNLLDEREYSNRRLQVDTAEQAAFVYSEDKPRLAVSGWFHAARASEKKDWPTIAFDAFAAREAVAETSTLQQLMSGAGAEAAGVEDDGSPGAFSAGFVGEAEVGRGRAARELAGGGGAGRGDIIQAMRRTNLKGLEELAEWVNPEYLSPRMMDQCATAFSDNGSTIQLHRFLKEEVAKRIVDAAIAADKLDGLGYMEASSFDAGVRGRWRKAGPPHRQRMLRLSTSAAAEEPGDGESPPDDEVGALLRELRDKLFASKAFKALLEKLLGGASVVASRRQARRFRPGLDYTLATPGVSWELEGCRRGNARAADTGAEKNGARSGSSQGGDEKSGNGTACGDSEDKADEEEEEERNFMVLDATLCFVDDREPYKEAAWRQDEVGGYVTYLGGEEDGDDEGGGADCDTNDGGGSPPIRDGAIHDGGKAAGSGPSSGGSGARKNDAAVYKADEGGSLVSVSAASNALSLVLRDDADITSFVKYVSSAAPGSRFDVAGEYLVVGVGGGDEGSSSDEEGVSRGAVLETVPEGDSEDDEDEEERQESGRKKLKRL